MMRVDWRNWNKEEVSEWLMSHELVNVANKFRNSNIGGRNLEAFDTHELKSFGLSKKEIAKVSFLLVLLHRSDLHPDIKPTANGGPNLPYTFQPEESPPPHQFCDRVALEFLSRPFGFQVSLESDLEHSLNYPRVSTINNVEISEAGVSVGMYITSINQEPIELGATLSTLTHLLSETRLPCTIVFAQSKRQPPGYDDYNYNAPDYQPRRISSINLNMPGVIYSNFENNDFESTTPPRKKKNGNNNNSNKNNNNNVNNINMNNSNNHSNANINNKHHTQQLSPPTHDINHKSSQRRTYEEPQDVSSDDEPKYQWKPKRTNPEPKRKTRQPSSTEVMLLTGEVIPKFDAQSCHDCGRWCKDDDAICATDDEYYCELCFDSHKCQKCGIWSVGVNTKLMLDLCEECKNTVRSTWAETPSELEALERETFTKTNPGYSTKQPTFTTQKQTKQWQDVVEVYYSFPFPFTITPTDPFPIIKDVDDGLALRDGDTICSVNEIDVRGQTAGEVVSVLANAGENFPMAIGFLHSRGKPH